MNFSARLTGGLFAALISLNANATAVVYQITGDLLGQFLPVTSDPVADLLGVPRNSNTSVPIGLRFTVDLDSAPLVLTNNAVVQEFIYPNAVTSVELSYNGEAFQSLRPLADQEIIIEVTNSVAPTGNDTLELKLNAAITQLVGSALFDSRIVPFNQTINGNLVENASVAPASVSFSLLKAGALGDGSLPGLDGVFDSPTLFAVSSIIGADFGTAVGAGGGAVLSGSSPIANLDFSITPVPVPAAFVFLLSGLAGLAGYSRQR